MRLSKATVAALALAPAVFLAACSGSQATSPTATAAGGADASGVLTASGNGPGGGSTSVPGSGTCDHDCTGTGSPNGAGGGYGPGDGTGYGPGSGLCGVACTGSVDPGPGDLQALLGLTIQEEYKAEMLYRSVVQNLGEVQPFSLIVAAEAQHVSALQLLFTRRGWVAPASAWSPGDFPRFATLADACAAGVVAETEDAAFYDPYLARADLPQDVVTVMTNLQAASLQHHLPAFERCR